MPQGFPPAEALSSRQVGAFSLDTSVVEANGYRFEDGALRLLRSQIPPWMKLVMSSIICREITARRILGIHKAEQQVLAGYQDLLRLGGASISGTAPSHLADVVERALDQFDSELEKYIAQFGGTQLNLTGAEFLEEMFARYFAERPPFGRGRDKKHEFPDAAALLSIEKYAADRDVSVVVVSKDEGWAEFAAASSRVYCVDAIQKLTDLFESTSQDALLLRAKIAKRITSDGQTVAAIKEAIRRRLPEQRWILPSSKDYRYSIFGSVQDVHVQRIQPPNGDLRLWLAGVDRKQCVAEFPVDVDVLVDAEMSIKDVYSSSTAPEQLYEQVPQSVEVRVLLNTVGNLLADADESNWEMEFDVVDEIYRVEPSFLESRIWPKVRKDFSSGFDDEDDLPF